MSTMHFFLQVDQNGDCQNSCNIDYDPDVSLICKTCINLNPNKYNQTGIYCDATWITEPTYFCVPCKYQFGVCKRICDPHYTLDPLDPGYVCQLCDALNLVDQNGVYQDYCDAGFHANVLTGICEKCFYQNGICQTSCDSGFGANTNQLCFNL